MSSRALKWLLPLVALLAIRAPVRVPEPALSQVYSVRAASESPESARTETSRTSSVVASNAKAPPRAVRPGEHDTLPELRSAARALARSHERETGLDAAPVASRELAMPFDATAPPRLA